MASSRRSPPDEAPARGSPEEAIRTLRGAFAAALLPHDAPGATFAVALSGGRDSIALLDAAAAWALLHGRALVACHVHHGLSLHADAWARFCAAACERHGIALRVERVTVARGPRTSLEASARAARYAALAAMARGAGASAVLLAHHQDDQAETLLLQLMRGAGPRGLAAMPAARDELGVRWLRPLLGVPRSLIERYCAARALAHVEDDSNACRDHRRNALRHDVVPALRAITPGYPATLARAAAHQADAARLIDELAAADAAPFLDDSSLHRDALHQGSPQRAGNVLRWFLAQHGLPPPPTVRLCAMVRQLRDARSDARVRLVHAGVEIGVFRERIFVHTAPPPAFERAWHGEPSLTLPHGCLRLAPSPQGGLDLALLFAQPVAVRSRVGGERIRLSERQAPRALKRALREAGVAPWTRAGLPLVFSGGVLAAVPGVGVDVAFRAAPGVPGAELQWQPDVHPPRVAGGASLV